MNYVGVHGYWELYEWWIDEELNKMYVMKLMIWWIELDIEWIELLMMVEDYNDEPGGEILGEGEGTVGDGQSMPQRMRC